MIFRSVFTILTLVLLASCAGNSAPQSDEAAHKPAVRTGAERFLADFPEELEGKRLGLVMNPTSRVGGVHMVDTLLALGHSISALFAPEHGFRGDFGAGETIVDGIDQATGLQVFSLHGAHRKPTADMLSHVDVLIFDIQDVGARFYTYISTLGLVLEAAYENNVDVWVLDRPNPAGGEYVAGYILDMANTSFVGAFPITAAHGLTMGEFAKMIVGENWQKIDGSQFQPKVVTMDGWKRSMLWPETGLEWIPPSPNIPNWETSLIYLGTCIFEGSTFSEGRGTQKPFLYLGSPELVVPAEELARLRYEWGIEVVASHFTPISDPKRAPNPKLKDQECTGVEVLTEVSGLKDPVAFGYDLFRTALKSSPNDKTIDFLRLLTGKANIDEILSSDQSPADFWKEDVEKFRQQRAPYLLY